MKKKLVGIFVLFALLAPTKIFGAALVIEPFLGLEWGKWAFEKTRGLSAFSAKGNAYGYVYGADLLYQFNNAFFGFEYTMGSLTWKYNAAANSASDDGWKDTKATPTSWGPLVGIKTSSGDVSGWVGYYYSDQLVLDQDPDPNESAPTFTGTSINIGIAYRTSWLKLNLVYKMHNFNKISAGGASTSLPGTVGSTTYASFSHQDVVLLAAIPFTLFGSSGGGKTQRAVPRSRGR